MHQLSANGYSVEIGSIIESSFAQLIEPYRNSKCFIIVDENTQEYCLEYILTSFDAIANAEVIVLPEGEENKQLQIVGNVWEVLTEYETSRHDLIINLGGGLISDIGGFIASCYKRGMAFINIPTSLLAMVDASIGGKTGVNLGVYKNQIGLFNNPIGLFIDPIFLGTLPAEELLNGYAEMLKHGLISDVNLYNEVLTQMTDPQNISLELLTKVIDVKRKIVLEDPTEKGPRKKLNFGHTFGHAIEGQQMMHNPIKHGYAVGLGMILESFVSFKRGFLKLEEYNRIELELGQFYQFPAFSDEDINEMIALLVNDKKNRDGKILTCLIEGIGNCTYDHELTSSEALEVFLHFKGKQVNPN